MPSQRTIEERLRKIALSEYINDKTETLFRSIIDKASKCSRHSYGVVMLDSIFPEMNTFVKFIENNFSERHFSAENVQSYQVARRRLCAFHNVRMRFNKEGLEATFQFQSTYTQVVLTVLNKAPAKANKKSVRFGVAHIYKFSS